MFIIRRGKGLKHREVLLVQAAREPLDAYFKHREHLAEYWRERAMERREAVASWSTWPDAHLFLDQRGPLTERGIREIIAKLGKAAKLASPLVYTICVISLPNRSSIQQPMDLTGSLCHSQRFSHCWAMPISRQRPSTRGSRQMTSLV